ncbi:hypothetical protein [Rhizobium leguminosarum]|uniref:hypothetical protein n=1 Tax=Rhizobium leguminosarum TaxID=384 RepID=UPI002E0ED871|nr:hypothetical protein U8Q02_41580 [Rhizobium leguminosarum]
MSFVTVPKEALLGALAEFKRSQKVNPEYDLIDHLQNAMAEVWPQHVRPLDLMDHTDDEAVEWVTKNSCGLRRDDGRIEYGLTAVVRAYQAGKESVLDERESSWEV